MSSQKPWSQDVNLCEFLLSRHVREGRGEGVALLYRDCSFTYAEIDNMASKVGAFLLKRGVQPRDRIVLVLPDTPSFVAALFGSLAIGAIAVPLSPTLTTDEVSEITIRMRPRLCIVDEQFPDKCCELKDLCTDVVTAGDWVHRTGVFEEEASRSSPELVIHHRSANSIAYCLFSSGTSGPAKGIPHKHTDILECVAAYSLPVLRMAPSDRVLAVPKLTFGYGLGGNLFSSCFVGATSILLPQKSTGETIAAAADRYNPTLFLAQPRVLAEILQSDVSIGLKKLRLAVSAGEVLVNALYRRWRNKYEVDLLDGFGSTEVGHVFITNRIGDVKSECAGRTVDGFSVNIRTDGGEMAPSGTIGHLWVAGPSLATEYWEDPYRTRQQFADGWVRTGDLARMDQDGYIYISGRSDDMIKAGCGQWVSPIEIEAAIEQDNSVAECAVVGCADLLGIIRPKAYVVLRGGERPSAEIEARLKALVAKRWPELSHKHLGAVDFATSLPRNSNGKLQRFRLRPATLTEFSYQC
jgi:acyl-coenzyme A synthetase/AMP-(fatty) acid ligase